MTDYPDSAASDPNARTSIAIRCAIPHTVLWLYTPEQFCPADAAIYTQVAKRINLDDTGSYVGVTERGLALVHTLRLLRMEGVITLVGICADYICVEVPTEDDWLQVLPRLVMIIRTIFGVPDLPVSLMPAGGGVEDWHGPLLERLSGPLAPS